MPEVTSDVKPFEGPIDRPLWYVLVVKSSRFGGYDIVERIGVGGMAEVFRAHLSRTGGAKKTVCLKRVHPHLCTDQDFVTMFIQEARILLTLNHSNIVQAFDVGHDGGQYFLVMESLSGRDLINIQAESHKRAIPIPRELVVFIVMEVLEGLVYAHGLVDDSGQPLHIVHRDINPSNVMITDHGEVKILDFGIAKSSVRDFRTRTGIIKGKIGYMAPEQARGGTIDARADIFACGVMLHELLTNQKPFSEDGVLEGELVIRCDDELLIAILEKALARRPEDRYEAAGEMHQSLSQILVQWRARPTSLDVAKFARSLFGDNVHPPEESEELDSFDRHLAAQVPEILVSRDPSGGLDVQTTPDEAANLDTEQTEVDHGATEIQDPIHALKTESLGVETDEVTAPIERASDPQDKVVTEPIGGPTEELVVTGPSRGVEPDDNGSEPTAHDIAGGTDELLKIPRSGFAWWVIIAACLLIGVMLGVRGALRSSEPPGLSVASVAEAPGTESTDVPNLQREHRSASDAEVPGDSGSDGGSPEWVEVLPRRCLATKASRQVPRAHRTPSDGGSDTYENPVAHKGLSQQEVLTALKALRPYMRVCLTRSNEPISTLRIRLQITGAGSASYIGASPHPPSDVTFCLKRVMEQARFAATGADPITVVYPLHVPGLDR